MSADVDRLVDQIVRTRGELSEAMADPDLAADRARYAEVNRRWSGLVAERSGEIAADCRHPAEFYELGFLVRTRVPGGRRSWRNEPERIRRAP